METESSRPAKGLVQTSKMGYGADILSEMSMSRFPRAIGIFIRTPMRKFMRSLPERSEDLGGTRKTFDLNVFVLESWISATGRKQFNPKSYLVMESFSQYICSIDDILDSKDHPPISTEFKAYRTNERARKRVSAFVKYTKEMGDSGHLTGCETREIFKAAGNYRRQAIAALLRFEGIRELNLDQILKVKEETTGGMGAVMVEILSSAEKLPQDYKKVLSQAFSDSFMASQIADDMHDIHDDIASKVPNIAVAILNGHINEFNALTSGNDTSIAAYRRLAPESYQELMKLGQEYMSRIPDRPENIQVLEAIPRIFYKVIQLTSRGPR